jgi:hypothetical protein
VATKATTQNNQAIDDPDRSDTPPPHEYKSGDIYYCVNPLQFVKIYANPGELLKVTYTGVEKVPQPLLKETSTNTDVKKPEMKDANVAINMPPKGAFQGCFQFKFNLDEPHTSFLH